VRFRSFLLRIKDDGLMPIEQYASLGHPLNGSGQDEAFDVGADVGQLSWFERAKLKVRSVLETNGMDGDTHWSTRSTPCSMMGPSSRSAVTKCAVAPMILTVCVY
jgi:hypothetical protein